VYNNSHGKATLNSLDKASVTITNSRGLHAEPWYIADFTSKLLLLLYIYTFLTTVFAPVYIDMTADTNRSSTHSLCIAHLITSVRTLSKAFSKYTQPK